MCTKWQNKEFIWWFFLSILFIFFSFFATGWLGDTAVIPEWKKVIKITSINATDPVVGVLQAINTSTIFYASYFYVIKMGDRYNKFKIIVSLVLFVLIISGYLYDDIFVGYGHLSDFIKSLNLDSKYYEVLKLVNNYVSSSLLFFIFFISDKYLSKMSSDENEKAMLLFNSKYLSLPSLITLFFCGVMISMIVSYNPVYVFPFYAGIASCLLFTTNMIMALASSRWYTRNLIFTHKE